MINSSKELTLRLIACVSMTISAATSAIGVVVFFKPEVVREVFKAQAWDVGQALIVAAIFAFWLVCIWQLSGLALNLMNSPDRRALAGAELKIAAIEVGIFTRVMSGIAAVLCAVNACTAFMSLVPHINQWGAEELSDIFFLGMITCITGFFGFVALRGRVPQWLFRIVSGLVVEPLSRFAITRMSRGRSMK